MTRKMSSLLEAIGLAAVVVGANLFDYRLGVIAAGIVLVVLGLVMDPPRRTE